MNQTIGLGTGLSLVTGGSGHLGANLVRRLLREGVSVRVLVRPDSDNTALNGLDVERVEGDLRNPLDVEKAVNGCDRVYHCAAKLSTLYGSPAEQQEIFDCNVLGTRHVLQAAKSNNVTRVVVTGSLSGTGYDRDNPSNPCNETMPFYPFARHMPYETSKALVEHECLRAANDGVNVVIATSCAILGPHDFKPSRMGRTLCDFANGKMRAYVPGGFEFVAARDIVEGHLLAMQKGRVGQKYIFSSQFVTVDELMQTFETVTGVRRPRLRLPTHVLGPIAEVSSFVLTRYFPKVPQRLTPGAIRILTLQRRADCSKAKNELGYQPTPIVEAVQAAYEFFVEQGKIKQPKPTSRAAMAFGN